MRLKSEAFPSQEQKGAYPSVKNVKLMEDRAQKAKQLLDCEAASGVRHGARGRQMEAG